MFFFWVCILDWSINKIIKDVVVIHVYQIPSLSLSLGCLYPFQFSLLQLSFLLPRESSLLKLKYSRLGACFSTFMILCFVTLCCCDINFSSGVLLYHIQKICSQSCRKKDWKDWGTEWKFTLMLPDQITRWAILCTNRDTTSRWHSLGFWYLITFFSEWIFSFNYSLIKSSLV